MSDEDDEVDFDRFEMGDLVTAINDDGKKFDGTIVRIDYDDASLPWGVLPLDQQDEDNYMWLKDEKVEFTHYLDPNFVIQEDSLLEACW